MKRIRALAIQSAAPPLETINRILPVGTLVVVIVLAQISAAQTNHPCAYPGMGSGTALCAGHASGQGGHQGTCPCCRKSKVAGPQHHCGMPAPSYPVPFATPRPNLQTYYTYPPMMPHNSLQHYAGTYAFRHGPGMSRTTVHWREPKAINAAKKLHHIFELPR